MAWFKVDDKLHSSRKLLRIPRRYRLAALGLWTLAGSWSADQETDGRVPDYMVEEWGGNQKLVDWLVKVELWREIPNGTQFVNWDEYQPTKAENEAARQKNRDKLRNWRDRNRGTNRGVTGLQNGSKPGGNPAPVPSRPDPYKETLLSDPAGSDAPAPLAYPEAFTEFWQAYPRKDAKKAAYKAWKTAAKTAAPEAIIAGANRYATDPNRDPSFTAMPTTWLNAGRWEDGPLPGRNSAPPLSLVNTPWDPKFHQTGARA